MRDLDDVGAPVGVQVDHPTCDAVSYRVAIGGETLRRWLRQEDSGVPLRMGVTIKRVECQGLALVFRVLSEQGCQSAARAKGSFKKLAVTHCWPRPGLGNGPTGSGS